MRLLLFVTVIIFYSISLVYGDDNVENKITDEKTVNKEDKFSTTKTKRGIYGYATYRLPIYGQGFAHNLSSYARFTSVYKSPVATYTISPGNAVVNSFNVNYPKVFQTKPAQRLAILPTILVQPKPILPSVPIHANHYPVFVQKPLIQRPLDPHFSTPTFIPTIHSVNRITIPNILPQSTIPSRDRWRPVFSQSTNIQNNHINPPSASVLPPLNPFHLSAPSSQTSNNYYLPPDASSQQHYHQQHHDLYAPLQLLQEIQQQRFATPLSEQGYETASNNGQYTGLSSYEVSLNSRGRLY